VYVAILGFIEVSFASAVRVPFVAAFTKEMFELIPTAAIPYAFEAAAKARSARVISRLPALLLMH
jgi:hypothetical protein